MATPSKRINVMAFDPGGTTGYVLRAFGSKDRVSTDYYWVGGQLGPDEHHRELWELLAASNPDIIVCEDFVYQIRQNRGVDMPGVSLVSRDYIGIIKLYCSLTRKPLFMQSPSILTVEWVKDKALREMNALREPKTKWRHQNDATRHLIYFSVTELDRKDLLSPLRRVK